MVQATRPRPVQVQLRRPAASTRCRQTTCDATSSDTASKHARSAASGRCRRHAVSSCRYDACTCAARNRSAVRPCSCQQASNACKRTLRSPSIPAGRTRSFPPAQSIVSSTRQQQRAASSSAAACVRPARFRSRWHGSRAFVRLVSMRNLMSLIPLTGGWYIYFANYIGGRSLLPAAALLSAFPCSPFARFNRPRAGQSKRVLE